MKSRILGAVKPLIGVLLFALAIWALHKELKDYRYADVVRSLHGVPTSRLGWAAGLTLLSYFSMSGYDWLAFRYIRHPLPYPKIALASFVGYAFSNNVGLSVVAGGSVRYRLYSAWGMSTVGITKVVGFCTLSLWLGFLSTGGAVFLVEPLNIPASLHMPFRSAHPLGLFFLALLAAYGVACAVAKRPLKVRTFELAFPRPHIALAQVAIATVDWALAGCVLYALLSHVPLSFPAFLAVFLLAQIAGLLSQLPGGLGVFETVVVTLLSAHAPASAILGPLIAYRFIYYLFPFGLSLLALAAHEVAVRREKVSKLAQTLGEWFPGMVPQLLALASLVAGAVLLFSSATPPVRHRVEALHGVLPLAVLEVSHFLGSLVGVGLLFLGRGLQRRLDAAYHLAVILLGAGIALSLLKGLDWEEALLLSVMLAALLPSRAYFHRKAALTSATFSPGWIAAICVVLGASLWLGFFAFKHVDYSRELWWQFELSGNAPRALRGTVAAVAAALFIALWRLLRPARLEVTPPSGLDLAAAKPVIEASPETISYLALLGDKSLLFNEKKNAFIMYGAEGRSLVSLREPVGPPEEVPELLWRFRELADRSAAWTVFYQVDAANLHQYLDLGLTFLKFGEEARVPLEKFSLEGSSRKGLRYVQRKLEKEGFAFEVLTVEQTAAALPELKAISDAWLEEKNTREKAFSLGYFDEGYLRHFPTAVVRKDQKLVAFANLWPGAGKEELSIDLMRYLPRVSSGGLMDFLFLHLMLWGKAQGYRWFNMGMAPLSGLQDRALGPLWNRLGARMFRLGENFYNFQGLRQYKEKFDPEWKPKYLATPGGLALPTVLTNLAALVSRGLRGVVGK